MSMYEIEFKIRHEYRYGSVSYKNPQNRIIVWRTGGREVVEVIPKGIGDCSGAIDEITTLEGVVDTFEEDNRDG